MGSLQPPPLSSCSLFFLTWLTTQSCALLGLPRGTHLEPRPSASPTAHGGLSPVWGAPRAQETRTRSARWAALSRGPGSWATRSPPPSWVPWKQVQAWDKVTAPLHAVPPALGRHSSSPLPPACPPLPLARRLCKNKTPHCWLSACFSCCPRRPSHYKGPDTGFTATPFSVGKQAWRARGSQGHQVDPEAELTRPWVLLLHATFPTPPHPSRCPPPCRRSLKLTDAGPAPGQGPRGPTRPRGTAAQLRSTPGCRLAHAVQGGGPAAWPSGVPMAMVPPRAPAVQATPCLLCPSRSSLRSGIVTITTDR